MHVVHAELVVLIRALLTCIRHALQLMMMCAAADIYQPVWALWHSRSKEWPHWQCVHHVQEHCGRPQMH